MAKEISIFNISIPVSVDMSAYQYCWVKVDADGLLTPITAITDVPIGILQNDPAVVGEVGNVMVIGQSKLKMDAVCDEGAILAPHDNGSGQVAVATQYPGAQALEACTAQNELISVLVNLPLMVKA